MFRSKKLPLHQQRLCKLFKMLCLCSQPCRKRQFTCMPEAQNPGRRQQVKTNMDSFQELFQKGKILLFVLVVCFSVSVISAENLAAEIFFHDCTEHSCQPCLIIKILKIIRLTIFVALFIFVLNSFDKNIRKYSRVILYSISPVMQKVRINS